ncbi:MAG: UDP-3-O-(3-hydroxymyristoyl)glucosamine N-acyltransferase [Gammaproteobacteria bacterium]|nr:UDP-3-O-(3-hydroxymyristoyl)glucosamine N-acyltransferase [Gammaproteobacteria bacterium]MCP5202022.1 UDP-3-O-(3-hydroxymyristoyl)glucosamine N-acyltransferase [Gammaproteobacteria bacterium]
MACRLGDLARFVDGRLLELEYAENPLHALVPPQLAAPTLLTYVRGRNDALRATACGGILTEARHRGALVVGSPAIVVENLALACARAAEFLPVWRRAQNDAEQSAPDRSAGVFAPGCAVAPDAVVDTGTVIENGASIATGVRIGSYCRIGAGAVIGEGVSVGNRVRLGANVVIGTDAFAFVRDGASWRRVPTFGAVAIGDDVEILAHAVIHAGVFGDTVIGAGCVLDSHVLIGHDAAVGAGTAIAGHTAVAGAARIGRDCRIGGMAGIGEGVVIADGVTIAAMSMVPTSITRAGASYAGSWPAQPRQRWWRQVARLRRAAARGDGLEQLD